MFLSVYHLALRFAANTHKEVPSRRLRAITDDKLRSGNRTSGHVHTRCNRLEKSKLFTVSLRTRREIFGLQPATIMVDLLPLLWL